VEDGSAEDDSVGESVGGGGCRRPAGTPRSGATRLGLGRDLGTEWMRTKERKDKKERENEKKRKE
jgi:hypothetical protein